MSDKQKYPFKGEGAGGVRNGPQSGPLGGSDVGVANAYMTYLMSYRLGDTLRSLKPLLVFVAFMGITACELLKSGEPGHCRVMCESWCSEELRGEVSGKALETEKESFYAAVCEDGSQDAEAERMDAP